MINWERVNTLRDEVGAEDFDEVVELFLDEVEEVMTRLQTSPDLNTLEEDLHFLKGSALSLGFQSFSALCQAGESLSADGGASDVNMAEILTDYAKSKRLFQEQKHDALVGQP